jgi:hypothetical protein
MRKFTLVLAFVISLAGLVVLGSAGAATKSAAAHGSVGESKDRALEAASAAANYPPCGPYVSEGTSEICHFEEAYFVLEFEGFLDACRFGSSSGHCEGEGKDAPFPWGHSYNGETSRMLILWGPDGSQRSVTIASYWGRQPGRDEIARLSGHMPGPGSDGFTVTDGFAQHESDSAAGDHFYTPDLPGQAAGEVGGPLHFNFQNGSGIDLGAKLWVRGYLYLKH